MIADQPIQKPTPPEQWIAFNVNGAVRVKLTQTGVAEYRRIREEVNARLMPGAKHLQTEPKLDADGYYRDSMWSLMQDFGHLMRLGGETPFATTILLENDGFVAEASR